MKEIKAFQCDYCNRYYKHKSSAKRHENRCFRNPEVKACLTCGNFITDYETNFIPCEPCNPCSRDEKYTFKYNYCNHTGKSFTDEVTIKRQKFQHDCKHWIPIVEDTDD